MTAEAGSADRCTAWCSSRRPGGSAARSTRSPGRSGPPIADAGVAVLRSGATDVRFLEVDPEADSGPSAMPRELGGHGSPGARGRCGDPGRGPGGRRAGARWRRWTGTGCCARTGAGRTGCGRWSLEVERWLAEAIPGYAEDGEWYLGRPLLVTANDYEMGLYNGDTGVIVDDPERRARRLRPRRRRDAVRPGPAGRRSRPCTR